MINYLILILSFFRAEFNFAQTASLSLQQNSECLEFLKTLPRDYQRQWIQVPEDWSQPQGRKIRVFYYTNFIKGQIPVAYFYGGPLGVDHSSYKKFEPLAAQLNLGFVYIDQRGTGCSDAVPVGTDRVSLSRASLYDTSSVVKDAELIREIFLGKEAKWKVFGQSWGGAITSRYVYLFPKNLISAHNFAGTESESTAEFMYATMVQQQRVAKIFSQRHPRGMKALQMIKKAIQPDDCYQTQSHGKICGSLIYQSLLDSYLGLPELWPQVEIDFIQFIKSNGRVDLAKIFPAIAYIFDFFYSPSIAATNAVWRQQTRTFHPSGSLAYDCELAYGWLKAQGIDRNDLLMDHCMIVKASYNREWTNILSQVVPAIPQRNLMSINKMINGLRSNPRLKYYLYSGGVDIYDRGIFRYEQLKKERQISYTHFPNSGHFGYYTEARVWQDLVKD